MPTLVYVWFGMIIVLPVAYMMVMMRKRKQALAGIDMDQERAHAAEYQNEILRGDLKFLGDWMKDAPIDACTSASMNLSLGDHAKNMAKDAAKSIAWAAVGVKARYRRVETPSYVALSGDDLYFLTTDTDGELDQRSMIGRSALETATLRPSKAKGPAFASAGDPTKRYDLVFTVDGEQHAIVIHDRIGARTSVGKMLGGDYFRTLAKHQVVGERFIDALKKKYPNLDAGETS